MQEEPAVKNRLLRAEEGCALLNKKHKVRNRFSLREAAPGLSVAACRVPALSVAPGRWGSAGLSPDLPDFVGISESVCVPGYTLGGKCLTGFEPP